MVQPHEADAGRVDEAGVPEYAGGGVVAACVGGDLWCRDAQVAGAGRVGAAFAVEPGFPLVSAWDLGLNDSTAIWAAQVVGYEVRLLKFYQSSGLGMTEYAEVIRLWERELGMSFDEHLFPHDGNRRNWGGDPMSLFGIPGLEGGW